MIDILYFVLFAAAVLWLFLPPIGWIMYLAVMNLRRYKDDLRPIEKVFGYPSLFLGYLLDLILTVTWGTLLFLDLPQEKTLTKRLKRYDALGSGWRYRLTRYIADNLLDRYDPSGRHI